MNAVFVRSDAVAKNTRTFWFKPERPVRYIAGQFTELYLPHDDADNRGERRWFTLSSAPSEELLAITTNFSQEGGSTFKQILQNLEPGAAVSLAEPMGDFVLPKDMSIPIVFAAAGIGITPMYSMVKQLHATNEQRNLRLLYALGELEDDAFTSTFEEHGTPVSRIVKRPPETYSGETGSLETDRILATADKPDETLFYLAGPELLVEKLTKEMISKGIVADRIISDYFPGYLQF